MVDLEHPRYCKDIFLRPDLHTLLKTKYLSKVLKKFRELTEFVRVNEDSFHKKMRPK